MEFSNRQSILRLNLPKNTPQRLPIIINQIRTTIYKLGAKMNEAPEVTDCVTVIRFIVQELTQADGFPLTLIGNMPRHLINIGYQDAHIQDIDTHKIGDLVFIWGVSRFKVEMIRHVGILLDDRGSFFHSIWKKNNTGGGTMSQLGGYWGEKVATDKQMMESKDPRTKSK